MEAILRGTPEEIAALVLAIQKRQRGALQVDVPENEAILAATNQEQNQEQLQKILKRLIELLSGTAPLILCPNQEWANLFHEYLEDWLEPMIAHRGHEHEKSIKTTSGKTP